ncbi:zinc finger domain-containing protein [Streptomyces rhizosphaericus]|uniref:zinc finger domain-containing protein n=1 Tax=Streptomyces rhizosphaericus TaxID=114699 RepID=UPI004064873F
MVPLRGSVKRGAHRGQSPRRPARRCRRRAAPHCEARTDGRDTVVRPVVIFPVREQGPEPHAPSLSQTILCASGCDAQSGSPCRSRGGAVASAYHTRRFTKVPPLKKALRVAPPSRLPARGAGHGTSSRSAFRSPADSAAPRWATALVRALLVLTNREVAR